VESLKGLLLLLLSLYLLMLGYLYLAQRSFIYFPEFTKPVAVPHNFELQNEGLRLRGWVLNQGAGEALLYFGGNGEGLEHNLPLFQRIFPDRAVYLLSYRGYGSSEGEPDEQGIYSDAMALYAWVSARHSRVSVMGRSLGSGVATYVAASKPVERLALVTPFDSMVSLASRHYPIFPVRLLLQDSYRSAERAARISSRTLVLYAENDRIVPESNTLALISAFSPGQVSVTRIAGAGHNTVSSYDQYQVKLKEFFSESD
jgi:uncharacterized protein